MKIFKHEAYGWVGIVLILLAYALLSFKIIPLGTTYQVLNLVGSVGIVITAFYKKDHPSWVLNIIWFMIALIAIFS